MAFSKTIFVLVLLSLEMVSIKSVAAQDVLSNFAELLTSEALLELSKLGIPGLTQNSPSSPSALVFPAPDSAAEMVQPNPIYAYIADAARTIAGQPQPTTTAKPCGPCGPKPCEPEKVRIVVVTDCDENKSAESSNSNESTGDSEEIIVKPRQNYRSHRLTHY